MIWTADSVKIRADQTCWTADGYNGCSPRKGGGGVLGDELLNKQRIMRDDSDMLDILAMFLNR